MKNSLCFLFRGGEPFSATKDDDDEKKGRSLVSNTIAAALFLPLIYWLWPWAIPFGGFAFWRWTTWDGWIDAAWPVFAWGAVASLFFNFVLPDRSRRGWRYFERQESFGSRLFIGVLAGPVEEVMFRWILFLDAIVGLKVVNFLFFGCFGFGIPEWLHLNVFGWLADEGTRHYLHRYLFAPESWAVGAAIISVNAAFRDGHDYQGLIGWTNSWFLGMFFTWMTFTHGLLAAILTHSLYNAIVITCGSYARHVRENRG